MLHTKQDTSQMYICYESPERDRARDAKRRTPSQDGAIGHGQTVKGACSRNGLTCSIEKGADDLNAHPVPPSPFLLLFPARKKKTSYYPSVTRKACLRGTETPSVDFVDTSLEEGGFKSGVPVVPSGGGL